MALYHYFKRPTVADVPSLYCSLSCDLSPAAIKDAHTAVKKCHQTMAKPWGIYAKFTPENHSSSHLQQTNPKDCLFLADMAALRLKWYSKYLHKHGNLESWPYSEGCPIHSATLNESLTLARTKPRGVSCYEK